MRHHPLWLAALLLPGLLLAGAAISNSASLPLDLATPMPPAREEPAEFPELYPAVDGGETPSALDMPVGVPEYLRTLPFGETIESTAERHGLDPLLIASVVEAESNFQADAVSPRGALGLMQVMPFHVGEGIEAFDPDVNLDLGAAYLAELEERFPGRVDLVLAAYHAGPGAVDRYHGIPPYRSTRLYVERVLEIYLEHYSQLATGA